MREGDAGAEVVPIAWKLARRFVCISFAEETVIIGTAMTDRIGERFELTWPIRGQTRWVCYSCNAAHGALVWLRNATILILGGTTQGASRNFTFSCKALVPYRGR